MPNIFKNGGGAGIGSFVIVIDHGQLAPETKLLALRGAYEAGEQIYFSIVDDESEASLIPASGWIDEEMKLHLAARDFDGDKTYKMELADAKTESEIVFDLDVEDGISLGDGEIASQEEVEAELALKADLVDGKVPADQLPSYVDDVLEFVDADHFPEEGEPNKIYVALDTGYTYRWAGSEYVQIGGQDLSDYYNKTEVDGLLDNKQATLVSGTNIKTVNSESILGSGDIVTADSRIPAATSADEGKILKVNAQGAYGLAEDAGGGAGGMANPMDAAGDMIIGGQSGVPVKLAKGVEGLILAMGSNAPEWQRRYAPKTEDIEWQANLEDTLNISVDMATIKEWIAGTPGIPITFLDLAGHSWVSAATGDNTAIVAVSLFNDVLEVEALKAMEVVEVEVVTNQETGDESLHFIQSITGTFLTEQAATSIYATKEELAGKQNDLGVGSVGQVLTVGANNTIGWAAADTNMAPQYSASQTYAVNDAVLYQGVLYKCTTAINVAEAWTPAHWAQTTMAEYVKSLITNAIS